MMLKSSRRPWFIAYAAALVLTVLNGCNSATDGPSFKSPQDVFEVANTSIAKKDYKAFCQCLTSDSLDQLAGFLVLGPLSMEKIMLAMPAQQASVDFISKCDKVFKDHGVDTNKVDLKSSDVKQLAAGIKNKPAFVSDMILAMESNATSQSNFIQSRLPFGDSKLEDVTVEGDSATGTATNNKTGVKKPVTFAKVNEGWRISLTLDHF